MSYDTEVVQVGRRPVTLVEIHMNYCSLNYGLVPCLAAIGVTGNAQCFNTFATCQDTANYTDSTKVYRYCSETVENLPGYIPCVKAIDIQPTTIEPGLELGRRGVARVTFRDFAWHDRDLDKYADSRSYNVIDQGSYWPRWLKRNPYYQNRTVIIREGFLVNDFEVDLANFVSYTYQADAFSRTRSGEVMLTSKDLLKPADNRRAEAPVTTTGALDADINDTDTAFTLTPGGIGSTYNASGVLLLGNELMSYTRIGDDFTVVRAIRDTEAKDHSLGDVVQDCLVYVDEPIEDVVYDLLVNYGNIDASFIDFPAWQAEASTWLLDFRIDAVLEEPSNPLEYINEIIDNSPIYIWPDERTNKIKFIAIKPSLIGTTVIDLDRDSAVIQKSVDVKDLPDERISRFRYHFGLINPTEDLDKNSNYQKTSNQINAAPEGVLQYGQKMIREVFSRWYDRDRESAILVHQLRVLLRYQDNPRQVTFVADARFASQLWTGDIARITTDQAQNVDGSYETLTVQVLSVTRQRGGLRYKYVAQDLRFSGRNALIAPNTLVDDYSAASQSDKDRYGFICYNTGFFLDGTPAYDLI